MPLLIPGRVGRGDNKERSVNHRFLHFFQKNPPLGFFPLELTGKTFWSEMLQMVPNP